jgi:hypothetical protein
VDFVDGARTMTAKCVDAMSGRLFTLEQNAIVKAPAFSLIEPPPISSASLETSKMEISSSVCGGGAIHKFSLTIAISS